mmetsp:Transcript_4053/g.7276  ORF Transcript_4053/g.7276 Transcript_4053/m.7276 type:complete len:193 (-) Transcript_4053:133-711(-)
MKGTAMTSVGIHVTAIAKGLSPTAARQTLIMAIAIHRLAAHTIMLNFQDSVSTRQVTALLLVDVRRTTMDTQCLNSAHSMDCVWIQCDLTMGRHAMILLGVHAKVEFVAATLLMRQPRDQWNQHRQNLQPGLLSHHRPPYQHNLRYRKKIVIAFARVNNLSSVLQMSLGRPHIGATKRWLFLCCSTNGSLSI